MKGEGVGTSHVAALPGLQPGTHYYFAVGTARKRLATGEFTLPAAAGASTPAHAAMLAAPGEHKSLLSRLFEPAGAVAPPARLTWGNPASLPDHFARHGADFHAANAEEYARMAWQFGQQAKHDGLLVKVDDNGIRRVFDPRSGAFAAYNADGTTKTFFKPNSRDYFARQPGRDLSQDAH